MSFDDKLFEYLMDAESKAFNQGLPFTAAKAYDVINSIKVPEQPDEMPPYLETRLAPSISGILAGEHHRRLDKLVELFKSYLLKAPMRESGLDAKELIRLIDAEAYRPNGNGPDDLTTCERWFNNAIGIASAIVRRRAIEKGAL